MEYEVVSVKHWRTSKRLYRAAQLVLMMNNRFRELRRLIEMVGQPYDDVLVRYGRRSGNQPSSDIMACGGKTEVVIRLNGKEYFGIAYCSLSDQFCYKTGRLLALDRAIAAL